MSNSISRLRETRREQEWAEWNRIFQLLRFSGVLGQPRRAHPNFGYEIPENVRAIRSIGSISGRSVGSVPE